MGNRQHRLHQSTIFHFISKKVFSNKEDLVQGSYILFITCFGGLYGFIWKKPLKQIVKLVNSLSIKELSEEVK